MSKSRNKESEWMVFLMGVVGPFMVCKDHKVDMFIWLMFTLVASQLGTIINVINRVIFQGWDFQAALCPESASGSFYIFAVVMISSLISPLFISILNKKEPTFNKLKMIFVTLLFFTLILAAVFYAFSSQNIEVLNFASFKNSDVTADGWQLAFFIITVLASIYAFGLNYLNFHPNEYAALADDYQKSENEGVKKIESDINSSKDDGKGIAL